MKFMFLHLASMLRAFYEHFCTIIVVGFSAGKGSWKSWKFDFAQKSRFNDGKVIFRQTLLVWDCFGCVLSISGLQKTFWGFLRRIFGKQMKNQAKLQIFHVKIAYFGLPGTFWYKKWTCRPQKYFSVLRKQKTVLNDP